MVLVGCRALCGAFALVWLSSLLACQGVILEPEKGSTDARDPRGRDAEQTAGPAPTTRFARLTHDQWERTVRDLLRMDRRPGLSEGFRKDPGDAEFLFDNNGRTLSVDQALWRGYQRAAIQLAEQVATDPARLEPILPGGEEGRGQAEDFVRHFGKRVHRRPLTDEQVGEYMGLYAVAPDLYREMPRFEAGIRLMLEAFLQSPHFLYRTELSDEEKDGVIPLSGWEIASRLSYFLWDSMPDDELFSLAESGALRDPHVVAEQAKRMLQDPRADDVIVDFHQQLLEVSEFESIQPSDTFFPEAADDLGELAVRENTRFLQGELIEREGGYYELLTSNRTFVNDDLAAVYGLEGSYGDELVPAELDPDRRAGLFTQVGFLATNATSRDPDPIHRGVFLAERINCIQISAPPNDIPPLPEPSGGTNRQTIEELTEQPGTACQSCHGPTINPFGFPFESYDATGGWRTEDRGQPVDTTAEPPIDGEATPVAGAIELMHAMATSRSVHECYTKHWVEYAFGQPLAAENKILVQRLGERSLERASVDELLVQLVTSEAFLARSTEKLP
jgi:hypothetical protein